MISISYYEFKFMQLYETKNMFPFRLIIFRFSSCCFFVLNENLDEDKTRVVCLIGTQLFRTSNFETFLFCYC
jgi:hypothetical protein